MTNPDERLEAIEISKGLTLKIKERRQALGLTQRELGEKVNTTQAVIANWERGTFAPKTADLPALARALKCKHIDDLFPEEARP